VRRVGGGVVLWRNLDDIASDIVESIEAAQQNRPLARQKAGNLGRAGAGSEGGIETVDVETHVYAARGFENYGLKPECGDQ
jgi:hypothetical protein